MERSTIKNRSILVQIGIFFSLVIIFSLFSRQLLNKIETNDIQRKYNTLSWEKSLDDGLITDELKEIFDKGTFNTKFETYIPVKLIATKVDGIKTHYLFKCDNGENVVIYQDAVGKCFVIDKDGFIVKRGIDV